jgi:hypothetical protein
MIVDIKSVKLSSISGNNIVCEIIAQVRQNQPPKMSNRQNYKELFSE